MNPAAAFTVVAEIAIRESTGEERLAILDALSQLAKSANLQRWAAETQSIADAMRTAESLQLTFLERLSASNATTPSEPHA